eukprot:m.221523 g.221523  ORF g.221523 m.221523 type:complete len:745 (+) comp13841_c1_seq2:4645-6879(+)
MIISTLFFLHCNRSKWKLTKRPTSYLPMLLVTTWHVLLHQPVRMIFSFDNSDSYMMLRIICNFNCLQPQQPLWYKMSWNTLIVQNGQRFQLMRITVAKKLKQPTNTMINTNTLNNNDAITLMNFHFQITILLNVRNKEIEMPSISYADQLSVGVQCDGLPTTTGTQTVDMNPTDSHTTTSHNFEHNKFTASSNDGLFQFNSSINQSLVSSAVGSSLNQGNKDPFLSSVHSLAWDEGDLSESLYNEAKRFSAMNVTPSNRFLEEHQMNDQGVVGDHGPLNPAFNLSLTTHAALQMVHERTVAIFFPSVVRSGKSDELLALAATSDIRVVVSKLCELPLEAAKELFWDQRNDALFSPAVSMLTDGACLVCILAGPDVVNRWAKLAVEAPHSLKLLNSSTNRGSTPHPQLLLHASKSSIHAEKEIALLFDPKAPPLDPSASMSTIAVTDHEEDASMCRRALDVFGETVMARWKHDGWFYQYVLADYLGGGVFCAKDEDDNVEVVADNTFYFLNSLARPSKVGQQVLAEHPQYEFSFCPGVVSHISRTIVDAANISNNEDEPRVVENQEEEKELTVVFYDNMGVLLRDVIAYVLPEINHYNDLCSYALGRDMDLVSREVVCRFESDGLFYSGIVQNKCNKPGRVYEVLFEDGYTQVQDRMHIFSHTMDDESSRVIMEGDNAISLTYHGEEGDEYEFDIFEPATIKKHVQRDKFIVETWYGKTVAVRRSQLFYIPPSYFRIACEYINRV